MANWSIGKLAELADVSVDTIRFYEKQGLLPPSTRRASGYREYCEMDLKLLQFIRDGRALGFSLQEIQLILSHKAADELGAALADAMTLIDARVEKLERWRLALRELAPHLAIGDAPRADGSPPTPTKPHP